MYIHMSIHIHILGFLGDLVIKNLPANAGDTGLIPGSGRSPGEGHGNTPVFLPGKCHGQRSLAGYSPWGSKRVGQDLLTKQQQHIYIVVIECVLYMLLYT